VQQTLKSQVPAKMAQGVSDLLRLLGLVGPGFNYTQTLTSAMSRELAGFYDPLTQTMYLKRGLDAESRENTLNHELVHALQDQHFGLKSLTQPGPDRGDEMSALHALAEGDALSAMLDAALVDQGKTALDLDEEWWARRIALASQADTSIPPIVQRSMTAPYLDGLRFVNALRREGGWAAVNDAWKSPPKSSEQVLHPDKYRAREAPESVAVPRPPDDSFRLVLSDVQGEQAFRLVLEEHMEPAVSQRAASGWAGDRSGVYQAPGARALAWRIRYDSRAQAAAAWPAVAKWVAGTLADAKDAPRPGSLPADVAAFSCRDDRRGRQLAAAHWGRQFVVVALEEAVAAERTAAPAKSSPSCAKASLWLGQLVPD
jgi:hypothetical protein